jgi:hypothetical protein
MFGKRHKTVAKLIIQKYLRLNIFLIHSYLIDNEELKVLIAKTIEVECVLLHFITNHKTVLNYIF